MRKLYVKRERALACFAISYHCVVGQSKQEHLRWAEAQDRQTLMLTRDELTVRSGETICLTLGEEASSLFVIAYQEHGFLASEEQPISAGTDDLYYLITTQFDGNRRLSLALAPAAPCGRLQSATGCFSTGTNRLTGTP